MLNEGSLYNILGFQGRLRLKKVTFLSFGSSYLDNQSTFTTLEIGPVHYSDTLDATYQTTRCHNTEGPNVNAHLWYKI